MKFYCLFFLLTTSLIFCEKNPNLPTPYDSVELLPFDSRSHFGPRQANALKFLIKKQKASTVLEIGSYLGASSRFIAKLLPENGKVYAVDRLC